MTTLERFGSVVLALLVVASSLVLFVGPAAAFEFEQYPPEFYEPRCEPGYEYVWQQERCLIAEEPVNDDRDDWSPARFEIIGVNVSENHVVVGETVTMDVTVENVGDADGTYAATLTADGENVGRASERMDDGDVETFTFEVSFDTAESYEIEFGHDHIGRIYVYDSAADRDAALAELR